MKRTIGLFTLAVINGSVLYFIYVYVAIICSTKADNILLFSYEPSGMQLSYYFISFPIFFILAFLSLLHSDYFDIEKSLFSFLVITWFSYFILLLYVDLVLHFSSQINFLYSGSLIISVIAISYVIYSTYYQAIQLIDVVNQIVTPQLSNFH